MENMGVHKFEVIYLAYFLMFTYTCNPFSTNKKTVNRLMVEKKMPIIHAYKAQIIRNFLY